MQLIRNFLLILLVLAGYFANAQHGTDSVQTVKTNAVPAIGEQDSIAYERIKLNKTHMTVLGAWAAANIVQGSISAGNATGSAKYLHQMNVYFNTVNLALAGVNLLMVRKQLAKHYTLADNLKEQGKIEKILLLNMGLDATYIATGLYLKERGTRLGKDEPQGAGVW